MIIKNLVLIIILFVYNLYTFVKVLKNKHFFLNLYFSTFKKK